MVVTVAANAFDVNAMKLKEETLQPGDRLHIDQYKSNNTMHHNTTQHNTTQYNIMLYKACYDDDGTEHDEVAATRDLVIYGVRGL